MTWINFVFWDYWQYLRAFTWKFFDFLYLFKFNFLICFINRFKLFEYIKIWSCFSFYFDNFILQFFKNPHFKLSLDNFLQLLRSLLSVLVLFLYEYLSINEILLLHQLLVLNLFRQMRKWDINSYHPVSNYLPSFTLKNCLFFTKLSFKQRKLPFESIN